jgi:hypothetical protein
LSVVTLAGPSHGVPGATCDVNRLTGQSTPDPNPPGSEPARIRAGR